MPSTWIFRLKVPDTASKTKRRTSKRYLECRKSIKYTTINSVLISHKNKLLCFQTTEFQNLLVVVITPWLSFSNIFIFVYTATFWTAINIMFMRYRQP